MAGAAVLGRLTRERLTWQTATVVDTRTETARVRTLVLEPPAWSGHRAGQHVDVRLTAEDGYQAQRSYSIASAPGTPLAITVELLDDGEVSPYLVDEVRAGDSFEVRGPIGGYFVWQTSDGGPLLLVAGGSGIVPLMAMIRHRAASTSTVPARLVYSSRSAEDLIYREELESLGGAGDGFDLVLTLTRSQPPGWSGYSRRLDGDLLGEVAWPAEDKPLVYVCGPTGFVEAAAEALVELGHDPARIRTERFGATG